MVRCICLSGKTIIAGTNGGVFLSTDDGTSWNAANHGLTETNVYSLVIDTDTTGTGDTSMFAGTFSAGVFRTTDLGTTWTAVNSGLTYVYALAVSGANVFAGTSGAGVFLSTDNGASWTAKNSGFVATTPSALYANGPNLYGEMWGGGVFLSTDSGTH